MKLNWCHWGLLGSVVLGSLLGMSVSAQVLRPVELEAIAYPDDGLWRDYNRNELIESINHSLDYLGTNKAATDYANYPITAFSRERVRRSLLRFRAILQTVDNPDKLQQIVQKEFDFYKTVGTDGEGTVDFTAYFEPAYTASTVRTAEFQYPLYRQPANFEQWATPHPSRAALEGVDGIPPADSPLQGSELVWLQSRLQAYLVQVQGSARLQLTDGGVMTVGFDGSTDYGYVSLGKELVNDGVFSLEELTLPKLITYFETYPEKLSDYIPRNNRFIFFYETNGSPPIGSLGVPVTAHRSIATDKSLMPPGAIALLSTDLPFPYGDEWIKLPAHRYVLDQDTGSAIKGPGRVDIFLGTGDRVQEEAGVVNDRGELYYLLLKE
ncbi:MAG: murein transglycosylase [Limnothrix sp. RL_2_0]|nr:murein transglycosylase [Limnothrix sp. RL_2_0]